MDHLQFILARTALIQEAKPEGVWMKPSLCNTVYMIIGFLIPCNGTLFVWASNFNVNQTLRSSLQLTCLCCRLKQQISKESCL
jgi:hypothetical protein